ncbi:Ras- protein Rab-37 [Branchiostoma belcheri]|nr:Ras- protein Rab-37 [Branchiostoma belcheri]
MADRQQQQTASPAAQQAKPAVNGAAPRPAPAETQRQESVHLDYDESIIHKVRITSSVSPPILPIPESCTSIVNEPRVTESRAVRGRGREVFPRISRNVDIDIGQRDMPVDIPFLWTKCLYHS